MNRLQTIQRYRKLDSATIFGGIRAVLIAKTKNEYNAASGYEKSFMRGVNNQTMGKMLVGFARTLRMVPPRLDIINDKPASENSPEFEAMSSCTEENVLVIDAMRFHHASVGGDVKFLNLYMNKAEGVVTDGAIRDLNEVKKYNFKIFSFFSLFSISCFNSLWASSFISLSVFCSLIILSNSFFWFSKFRNSRAH